jgi:hypothetical protein
MIRFFRKLFEKRHCKLVMVWNGRDVRHWRLTSEQYKKLNNTVLPAGVSILSVMDI